MVEQKISEKLIAGIRKRSIPFLGMVTTPLPLAWMTQQNIHESGNQFAAATGYGVLLLAMASYIFQIFYVGLAIDEKVAAATGKKRTYLKTFLSHLLGIFIISIFLELISFIPMFFEGFLKNNFVLSATAIIVSKCVLSVPLYFVELEFWFRYFKRYGSVSRKLVFKKYKKVFLFSVILCAISVALPAWGWGLAVANVFVTIAGILIWEVLTIELHPKS